MHNDFKKLLLNLKENYDAISTKAEFEAEGADFEEVLFLKEISKAVNLDLTIKIGGAEAIRDIKDSKIIETNNIVAPMIESLYAAEKFIKSAKSVYNSQENINFYINIETKQGLKVLKKILKNEISKDIKGIILGRSDLINSLKIKKEDIDNKTIFNQAKKIAKITKKFQKEFIIGGNITNNSIDFLKKISKIHLTKFETRKIVFDAKILAKNNIQEAITRALEFELMWIKNKNNANNPSKRDLERIKTLNFRLN